MQMRETYGKYDVSVFLSPCDGGHCGSRDVLLDVSRANIEVTRASRGCLSIVVE